ncbi:hypothetical protein POG22_18235 [Geitlerinema sp. CS-897]|nr:hypothetical protein [Geitlerinema sp. CS-897]
MTVVPLDRAWLNPRARHAPTSDRTPVRWNSGSFASPSRHFSC